MMVPEASSCTAVLGLDVGKFSHWACCATRLGEVVLNEPVGNAEEELDALFSQVGLQTLVVVDQVRNIGALPIRRIRAVRLPVHTFPASRRMGRPSCSQAMPRPTSVTPS